MHISKKEMSKRMKFTNLELFDHCYEEGKSVVLYMGHYANWEWIPFANYYNELKHKDFKSRPVYNFLRNPYFDKLFFDLRSTFGSIPVEKRKVLRTIVDLERKGQKSIFTFISDQSPSIGNIHHWMNFLNQDTPTVTGAERIAKQTGYPVVYLDVQRIKRGHYTCEAVLITEDASKMPEFELTEKYMYLMEKTITRNPAYWLWTHKRWKHKRS